MLWVISTINHYDTVEIWKFFLLIPSSSDISISWFFMFVNTDLSMLMMAQSRPVW